MAMTGYKSRVIVKEHTASETSWAGTYKLMGAAKSIPSPNGEPNLVNCTSLEDDAETNLKGVRKSDSIAIVLNLEAEYLTALQALEGKQVDVIHLYGNDGIGGLAKVAYTGEISISINDLGGYDNVLEMTATIIKNTADEIVTSSLTVAESSTSGEFTVTAKS